jgi:hypothetical protein
MSTSPTAPDFRLPSAAAAPSRLGQGTAVEQSRAVAQVQAAAVMARQFPRDRRTAIAHMEDACRRSALAQNAFFEYRRGVQRVAGSTIKLAQELARIWGNIDYGMTELRRDGDQSEMLAYAWDLETNARFAQIVIVQHRRDKTVDGEKVSESLTDQRDIYEANTSNAARRLREAIFRVLPGWFVDQAESLCRATLENPPDDDRTLEQRIAALAKGFEERWGIGPERLEARVEKPLSTWTAYDVGQMQITWKTLSRGEVTVDDAFPQMRVSIGELEAQAKKPTPAPSGEQPVESVEGAEPAAKPAPSDTTGPSEPASPSADEARPADTGKDKPVDPGLKPTVSQQRELAGLWGTFMVGTEDAQHKILGQFVGRKVTHPNQLTRAELDSVLADLRELATKDGPGRELDVHLYALEENRAGGEQT